MTLPDLSALALPGAEIAVRVTPRAGREAIELSDGQIRVKVTAVAEDGRANAAVQAVLARAMGLAKTRLKLIRGEKSREKVFRVEAGQGQSPR